MIKIRTMTEKDLPMVNGWWVEQGFPPADRDMYPVTSYIAEYDGAPVLSASLFLMNCKAGAKIEHLVGIPTKKTERAECVPLMFRHIEQVAVAWGYKTLVLFSYEEPLKIYYENLGYTKTLENVTTFSKRIGE